jgi:ethanolamine utilization cobalamin adenosyltransferase
MKFITEMDLRNLYKAEPFAAYDIGSDTRFTPEARQFLIDKGIKTMEDQYDGIIEKKADAPTPVQEKCVDWRSSKLRSKMRCMASLFLVTGEELLSRDVILAKKVMDLGKQFRDIQKVLDGQGSAGDIVCKECTGIKADRFSDDLGDCFEITEFHIQLQKGKEIAILHHLRSALREIEPAILEAYEGSDDQSNLCESIIGKINQIINSLNLMICLSVGGKTCQR